MQKRKINLNLLMVLFVVLSLSFLLVGCDKVTPDTTLADAKEALQVVYGAGDSASKVTGNVTLATSPVTGVTVTWSSSNPEVISNNGVVVRGIDSVVVTLTATLTYKDVSESKTFSLTVPGFDTSKVESVHSSLAIIFAEGDTAKAIHSNVTLVTSVSSVPGVTVTWTSSNPAYLSNTGVVTNPAYGNPSKSLVLTAVVSDGNYSLTKKFPVQVEPESSDFAQASLDAFGEANLNEVFVTENLVLPTHTAEGYVILWSSDSPKYLSNSGVYTQPRFNEHDKAVTLTAKIVKFAGDVEDPDDYVYIEKEFILKASTVKVDLDYLEDAQTALTLAGVSNGVNAPVLLAQTAGADGVTVTWTSKNTSLVVIKVTPDNEVIAAPFDVEETTSVTIVATFHYPNSNKTLTKEFSFSIIKAPAHYSIAELRETQESNGKQVLVVKAGTSVTVRGVTFIGSDSVNTWVIDSEGDILLVYVGATATSKYHPGDVLDVTGTVTIYNGIYELGSTITFQKNYTEDAVDITDRTVVTNIDEYIASVLDGKTASDTLYANGEANLFVHDSILVTAKVQVQASGNYGTFLVNPTFSGDVPIDPASYYLSAFMVYYVSKNFNEIKALNGLVVTIPVILYSMRTDHRYYVVEYVGDFTDIIVDATAEQKVNIVKEGLTLPSTSYPTNDKVTLSTSGFFGTTIAWASDKPATIDPSTGVVTVTPGAMVVVKLTASISLGDSVPVTKEFTIKVGAYPLSTIKQVLEGENETYKVRGVVVAFDGYATYTLYDGSDYITLYFGAVAASNTAFKAHVGKEVTFEANRVSYGSLIQMNAINLTSLVVSTTTPTHPISDVDLDNVEWTLGALTASFGQFASGTKFEVVTITPNDFGNHNITVKKVGTEETLVFYYDSRGAATINADLVAIIGLLEVGYVFSFNHGTITASGNPSIPRLVPNHTNTASDLVIEIDDTIATNLDKILLKLDSDFEDVITLPATGTYGSAIVWSYTNPVDANNALLNLATGEVTVPEKGVKYVKLTATITNGSVSDTKEFNVQLGEPEVKTVTLAYVGSTTNMAAGNNATKVGLDPAIFTVTSNKHTGQNEAGLNANGYIALYQAGDGVSINVSIASGYTILAVTITVGKNNTTASAPKLDIDGVDYPITVGISTAAPAGWVRQTIVLPSASFSDGTFEIHNSSNANTQLWIFDIVITYSINE